MMTRNIFVLSVKSRNNLKSEGKVIDTGDSLGPEGVSTLIITVTSQSFRNIEMPQA